MPTPTSSSNARSRIAVRRPVLAADAAGEPEVDLPAGVGRRAFIAFCASMAAVLAVPAGKIAQAVAASPRLPIVWLSLQDCTGDTESFLRSVDPTVASLLFDTISLDYHETLMAAAGGQAKQSLDQVLATPGSYVCVVEGSIPTGNNGAYCVVGGESAQSLVQRVTANAKFTIAVGSCAFDGGIAAAKPNPTGAVGVGEAVPALTNLVNMPGCPVNGLNLVAAIVYYLTNNALPPLDADNRPLFAYQNTIHATGRCERHAFLEQGLMVSSWGDAGHRAGYCLVLMGCSGPTTQANCYQRNWNGTTWPIGAGSLCIGCTSRKFWDTNTPFYVRKSTTTTTTTTTTTAAGATVVYTVREWVGGFTASVDITSPAAVNGWTLTWNFAAGQQVTSSWNTSLVQTGTAVSAKNVAYNATIPAGGTVSFGFQGTWTGTNPQPVNFALNGVPCNGAPVTTTTAASTSSTARTTSTTSTTRTTGSTRTSTGTTTRTTTPAVTTTRTTTTTTTVPVVTTTAS